MGTSSPPRSPGWEILSLHTIFTHMTSLDCSVINATLRADQSSSHQQWDKSRLVSPDSLQREHSIHAGTFLSRKQALDLSRGNVPQNLAGIFPVSRSHQGKTEELKTKEIAQLNTTRDSRSNPFAVKDVIGTAGETCVGPKDSMGLNTSIS